MAKSLVERFMDKCVVYGNNECWHWIGSHVRGRGTIWHEGRNVTAPRVAFFLHTGKWPEHFACHTCDNPNCVNPRHLFDGDAKANQRDSASKGRNERQKRTHCPSGHPLSGDNLTHDSRGGRRCKTCHRENQRRSQQARQPARTERQRQRRAIDAALKDTPKGDANE